MAELDNEEKTGKCALLVLKAQEEVQERIQFNRSNRGRLNPVLQNVKDSLSVEVDETKVARDAFKLMLSTRKTKFQEAKKEEQNIKKEKRNSEHNVKTHVEYFILSTCSIQI